LDKAAVKGSATQDCEFAISVTAGSKEFKITREVIVCDFEINIV
jgi:hypothetical protein